MFEWCWQYHTCLQSHGVISLYVMSVNHDAGASLYMRNVLLLPSSEMQCADVSTAPVDLEILGGQVYKGIAGMAS